MDAELKVLEDIIRAIEEIDFFFESRPKRYDIYLSDICLRRAVERNNSKHLPLLKEEVQKLLDIK